jgi:beta-RFAP synthase
MPFEFPSKSIHVSAPSRLHFGLLSIGNATERKFGGAGLMIDAPRTGVRIDRSERFELLVSAKSQSAVLDAAKRWQAQFAPDEFRAVPLAEIPVRIKVSNVRRHSGLGSGTQLAFATAAALQVFFDQPMPSAEEMAMAMGRGKKSAIGSYGFFEGGFLVDRGVGSESVAPLDMRIDFPNDWKIVLIEPNVSNCDSVFGEAEANAFKDLPTTTQAESDSLSSLLQQEVVPAILGRDFSTFARSVTELGYRSGMFYEQVQLGAYATPVAQAIVDRVRSLGEFAVGQSSWGPTIFAIGPSEKMVNWLVDELGEHGDDVVRQLTVVSVDNGGVRIEADRQS